MNTIAERGMGRLSTEARERMISRERGPLFLCDWMSAVFVHFAVDPKVLQPEVPFELDCRDGAAYVSLVAFTMSRLRFAKQERIGEWLCRPIGTHGFLNVRTYVRHRDEPGIYFMIEWLSNRLSVLLGPSIFGLPYRYGRLDYRHEDSGGKIHDTISSGAQSLEYVGSFEGAPAPCTEDSLDAFLMERYTAYTLRHAQPMRFRVWHAPWNQTPARVKMTDVSLLRANCNWFHTAEHVGANFSPGVREVWVGGPAAAK